MNFDDTLKHYLPALWFRVKFFKYKYRKRGEPELWLIRHLVEPGTTAIDVGSSIGMYAAEMAHYAAKVIAFEANPRVAAFAAHVAPHNVAVINAALSSAPGRATLRLPLSGKGQGIDELGSIDSGNPLYADGVAVAEIDVQRLDDHAIANCSFIKIDVEAHEESVLEGAANLISAQRPVLMIELHEPYNPGAPKRLDARFAAQRYRGFFLSHGKLHPIAEFDPAVHQNLELLKYPRHKLPAGREFIENFLFIPEEKVARILARV